MSLTQVGDQTWARLGEVLWSWKLCGHCTPSSPCTDNACPAYNSQRLKRFHQFYQGVVAAYAEQAEGSQKTAVFRTHEDLFAAIGELRKKPAMTRADFKELITPKTGTTEDAELVKATNLAAKVLTMIDCSTAHLSTDRLEKGNLRLHWKDEVNFSKYLEDLFPTESHSIFSYPDHDAFLDIKRQLRARKLQKHLGLTFRPTHDIRNHLRLDRRQNVLEVYHYSSFIKEQLKLSRDEKKGVSHPDILPRQLLLEVLDSLQGVLFPLSDPKSRELLRSLVNKSSFDPDALRWEFSSIRRPGEDTITYVYLADRLSELYNELQNPTPRGGLWRWMERKSGARYMIMATLIGVIFAVILGMASLGVSSYQTWIAYQAWQHPVAPPSP